jgi:hypothetical protein
MLHLSPAREHRLRARRSQFPTTFSTKRSSQPPAEWLIAAKPGWSGNLIRPYPFSLGSGISKPK